MRITIVGTGYVGLVSGVCFSEFGHRVVCVDIDHDKIEQLKRGEVPIFEPGLEGLLQSNIEAGRLSFTENIASSIAGSDVVLIAVGTPSRRGDGHADLSFVYEAAEQIAAEIDDYTVIVAKSTVPVGTAAKLDEIFSARLSRDQFDIVSNPEFLREGSAIEDFMRPNRVIIGTESERARITLRQLYKPLYLSNTPILFADWASAELIKYASNAFLATKIGFVNEMADLCERIGADIQTVATGMGLDKRIGSKFLHAGPGYGGSCFPKDTLALLRTAESEDIELKIVDAVIRANDNRKRAMADRIVQACGGSVEGKTIGVLGLTFKPNTDDMRESPSLTIVPALVDQGAKIRAFDPAGMEEAATLLKDLTFCKGPYETLEGADALVILTEWNEFRALDFKRAASLMKTPVLIDLRNVYSSDEVAGYGFRYFGVGC